MKPVVKEAASSLSPQELVAQIGPAAGVVLLQSALTGTAQGRYSFVAANPFLTFRSWGSRCEWIIDGEKHELFGNPWRQLDLLIARYELLDEIDLPFPSGGCFGYWGYDLKNFVEPTLPRNALNDLELPDCCVGFYSNLVAFDHLLGKTWIIGTGLAPDGSRDPQKADSEIDFWEQLLSRSEIDHDEEAAKQSDSPLESSFSEGEFLEAVRTAQEYIRLGHIYQVNLSHRIATDFSNSGWQLYRALSSRSPAPFAAYLHCDDFEIASSSPELFLRLSGSQIVTRPIKGTRPRDADPTRDAQLTYELQTSAKEIAELVMITDLLRNDLGRVCEYGSVQVPELVRLERYAQVQHLVSTISGRLRPDVTHFEAFSSCFPGGSITGAPKIRAMQIIDELEPISRGPYTGALGYLGFNRETQLSITIRTAVVRKGRAYFHAGAGIVADSNPQAEYQETLAKARGFMEALSALQNRKSEPLPFS